MVYHSILRSKNLLSNTSKVIYNFDQGIVTIMFHIYNYVIHKVSIIKIINI